MKHLFFILSFLFLSQNAFAACSGGYDGANAALSGCSEIGNFEDLIYKRDDNGMVLGKRTPAELKSYLISEIENRLGGRGVTLNDRNGKQSVTVNEKNVVFDLFDLNGDKIYTYTIDLETGIPENEKELIRVRNLYEERKATARKERKERIARMQALADKIKEEEIDNKAAAKK